MENFPTSGILLKNDSLVHYDDPTVIPTIEDLKNNHEWKMETDNCQIAEEPSTVTEILDCIAPPREWEEKGHRWIQRISCEPATREDVIKLCRQLDMTLQQQEARYSGICPVRRRLMKQCFDEIIRQVTVDCSDRGMLLLRVRDEAKKALDTYHTVFESSVAFSVNKALNAEQQLLDTTKLIAEEREIQKELKKELSQVNATFRQLERDLGSQLEVERIKNIEEIEFLKKTNIQLKAQYEGIVIIKK